MRKNVELSLLAAFGLALQSCATVPTTAQDPAVRGVMPIAGYDEIVDGTVRSTVRFYRTTSEGMDRSGVANGAWFATRARFSADGSQIFEIADEGCRGLQAVLSNLAEIELGGIDLPGISEANLGLEPGRDGPVYRIWGQRRELGLNSSVSATAMSGQIGSFGRTAGERLEPCWTAYRE